jgi:hypothetical protein
MARTDPLITPGMDRLVVRQTTRDAINDPEVDFVVAVVQPLLTEVRRLLAAGRRDDADWYLLGAVHDGVTPTMLLEAADLTRG